MILYWEFQLLNTHEEVFVIAIYWSWSHSRCIEMLCELSSFQNATGL